MGAPVCRPMCRVRVPRIGSRPPQDSDSLRAVCLTSVPPIDYWTPQAHAVVRFVQEYNAALGDTKVPVPLGEGG